jgi:outer membrane receptor for ferrienterochelin and colicin
LIFNVEDDPDSKGQATIDVFRKLPFVTVDRENNIRLNGQTNFKVLLNGRETSLFARNLKEALKGFPGALISKIEVIMSPSAKYDAEGVGGIINVVTKKKVRGYNAYLNAYYNTNNLYGASANLNIKSGKIGFTAYYGASKGFNQPGTNYSETVPLVRTFFTSWLSKGNSLSIYFWHSGSAELSWDVDSLNTLVLYATAGQGNSINFRQYNLTTRLTDSIYPILYILLSSSCTYCCK